MITFAASCLFVNDCKYRFEDHQNIVLQAVKDCDRQKSVLFSLQSFIKCILKKHSKHNYWSNPLLKIFNELQSIRVAFSLFITMFTPFHNSLFRFTLISKANYEEMKSLEMDFQKVAPILNCLDLLTVKVPYLLRLIFLYFHQSLI